MEILVLAIVGVVVIGPEKLPGLIKDGARMLKTLRELATGARQQLRDELGPEFADVDFRNLNPRTAVTRMVFGDDDDLARLDPRGQMRNMIFGDDDRDALRAADPREAFRDARRSWVDADDDSEPPALRKVNGAPKQINGAGASSDGRLDMSKPAARPAAAARSAAVTRAPGERPRPRPRPAAPPTSTYGDDVT
ncbi:Sec-independent protein translocase family protein [Jatrophihabitans fulvus]